MTPAKKRKMVSKTTQLLKDLQKMYAGKWVSVSEDYSRLIAFSDNLGSLVNKLNKEKRGKGLIVKVPPQKFSAYVG